MYSWVLILSIVLLCLILVHLFLKKFNIFMPVSSGKKISFLSDEDSFQYIVEKAKLNDEDKTALEILFTLISGIRLHYAFEDQDILNKWLQSVRKAVEKNNSFDQDTKDNLIYCAYEIYRKINNTRIMLHPSVKKVADIGIGQVFDIKISRDLHITGEFMDSNFHSLLISISEDDYKKIKSLNILKKNISISFWKIMDASYGFDTKIINISKSKDQIMMYCSTPKQISCLQIQAYPRQNTEIPVKFRQGSILVDPNSGALQENFGRSLFGILNNLGPKGCSIITHFPIPEHTTLQIEIPLFSQLFYFKGTIRSLSHYTEVYTLHLEFSSDTPKKNILQVYRYIFADDITQNHGEK